MMKKLYTVLIVLFALTIAQAQNDIKARIEFEEAEKAFTEENYETALKHLNQTEKQLGRWTPNVSYLKIESLYALTDMDNFGAPTMQPLYEEVTQYMAYLNKLKSDDVPMDKYKVVYGIEKTVKVLKLDERQSTEFLKAKKEHDAGNYDTAKQLWESLVKKNNSWAMRNLGVVYEIKKENENAKEWYLKAMDKGNSQAAFDLVRIDDITNPLKYYEIAMQMGHPNGSYAFGFYADKDGNGTKAMEYYQQAATLGSAASLYKIGDMHYDAKDYSKAFFYFKKAKIKGNIDGTYNLGTLYFDGNGVEKNISLAMEYWLKAANAGNTSAMYMLGLVYKEGIEGYTKDYKKAEEWYLKAGAINSNFYSLLGELYSLSDNYNAQKALEYYEKAAEGGYTESMLDTANLYFSGKGGIEKDYAKAAKYYEKYYEKEKKNESYLDNLIDIYNRGGFGVEKDKEKAKQWKNSRKNK